MLPNNLCQPATTLFFCDIYLQSLITTLTDIALKTPPRKVFLLNNGTKKHLYVSKKEKSHLLKAPNN